MKRLRLRGAYPLANGSWKAQIKYKCKNYHIGIFDTEQEAHEAYKEAYKKFTGLRWNSKDSLYKKIDYLVELMKAKKAK